MLSASSANDAIVWYKNDGSQNFTKINIATDIKYAFSVFAIDLNTDGDIDMLSGSSSDSLDDIQFARDSVIVLYENDGSQNFTKTNIINYAALSVFLLLI